MPSGNYAAGTQVTVSANAPKAGAQFAGWKGDIAILPNPSLPTTIATIPSMAVTITATYTAHQRIPHSAPCRLTRAREPVVPGFARFLLTHRCQGLS